ncbi:MAG TPA: mandelate racemase/muconate lactonizing enzyme family protein, partial [Burkholderiales bacterium]|nr:mandelate racemase/muconate lactonizing enzyme family protein [Burkholderiales bacterium]
MKIARTTAHTLRVPYHFPLIGETQHALVTFVEIETDDGLKGHAFAGYPLRFSISDFINREAGPEIAGMDPMRPEAVRTTLYWKLSNKYYMGTWSCAASMIDVALWDIRGKALKQPIWKLMGGAREKCPVYITWGLPRYSREELVESAKQLIAEGHTQLKMAIAASANPTAHMYGEPTDDDILEDAARIRHVREALGDKVTLMIDANKNPKLPQAIRLAQLVESCNLAWFEDPVLKADPRLMARLRRETRIPIAAGSSGTFDLSYLREYFLNEAIDIAQPNVRDIGGFTGALHAAGLAQAFNIQLEMGGNYPHLNMHLHAGVPNGGRVEFHLGGWRIGEALFDGMPAPVKGTITLPTAPGLGFTPKAGILDLAVK